MIAFEALATSRTPSIAFEFPCCEREVSISTITWASRSERIQRARVRLTSAEITGNRYLLGPLTLGSWGKAKKVRNKWKSLTQVECVREDEAVLGDKSDITDMGCAEPVEVEASPLSDDRGIDIEGWRDRASCGGAVSMAKMGRELCASGGSK